MRLDHAHAEQARRLDDIQGRIDPWLLIGFAILASLGVVMVASSSIAIAESFAVDSWYFAKRHVLFLGAGLLVMWMIQRTELRAVEKYAQWLLIACFLVLLAVLIPGLGRSINGARRWINLGFSGFQAVEAVKLLLIVWLASYLKRYHQPLQESWRALLKPLGVLALLVAALLAQPDFGSALLLCAIVAGMLVLGGANLPRLMAPVLVGLPILALIAVSEAYRMRRLTSFLDPWADPFKDGFQLAQAQIAIGRGEWLGVGLGASVQKLFYLPEAHTDFIFAVIAEELGFVGVLLVIALYAGITGRALFIGARAVQMGRLFAGYCAYGVALWIGLQAFVSIGVNLGVLPTKGLTLPLVSYGGSSVLMICAAVGLLLRVGLELDRAERQVARARGTRVAQAESARAADLVSPAPSPRRARIEPRLGEPV